MRRIREWWQRYRDHTQQVSLPQQIQRWRAMPSEITPLMLPTIRPLRAKRESAADRKRRESGSTVRRFEKHAR